MSKAKAPERPQRPHRVPRAAGARTIALTAVLVCLLSAACVAIAVAAPQHRDSARAHQAIIGGQVAQPGQLPSVAEILDIKGHRGFLCSGTVVAPALVMTAGHCAEDIRSGARDGASGYVVLTGAISDRDPAGQISRVIGVLVYEGFSRRVASGDAALLVLATPTTAPPLKLAGRASGGLLRAGTDATIAGWGLTHPGDTHVSQSLRSAHTVVQRRRWCAHHTPFFTRNELCAIDSVHHTSGGCFGDSGGPLIATNAAGAPVQIGIVSHGDVRCSTHRAAVFTRVDVVASWVQTWIRAYTPHPPPAPAPAPAPTTP